MAVLCAALALAALPCGFAQPPATSGTNTPSATTVGVTPGGAIPYWQAPALPSAVIQGGAIPPGWTPQPVPYQGIGPDGKPITQYYAPTYVFTYQVGPPVIAPAVGQPVPINRVQAPGYTGPAAASPAGWNYQTQGVAAPAYTLPPPTTARYAPQPYQYPPGAPQLQGTAITPPAPAPPAPPQYAPPVQQYQPPLPQGTGFPTSQPLAPPPNQWVPAPTAPANPTGQAFAAAAPAVMAGAAGAAAAGTSSASAASSPAAPVPVQPVSSTPMQPVQSPATRSANSHLWRVVGVHDGDTVTCLDENNQQQKIRLAEMDAPEIGQDFGKVSRDALADAVFGKTVEVRDEGKDRYGRWIAHLFVNGEDVNRQMIATGNAWHYAAYSKDASLAALQDQAKAQRLGLWAQPNPTPPWEFRANKKASKTAS